MSQKVGAEVLLDRFEEAPPTAERVGKLTIPKLEVTKLLIAEDIRLRGSIKSPLRISNELIAESGLKITSSGDIDFGGATLTNYVAAIPTADYLDLANQSVAAPTSGNTRLYSDTAGNIAWKQADGRNNTINTAATTASRTWTFPDSSGTFVNSVVSASSVAPILAVASTDDSKIINGLASDSTFVLLTQAPLVGGDISLSAGVRAVLTDATQTLQNKTLDAPKILPDGVDFTPGLLPVGISTSDNRVRIWSNYVDQGSVQTLFQKTLSAPNITGLTDKTTADGYAPIGVDTATGAVAKITDLVTLAGVQTITDKTLSNVTINSATINSPQISSPVVNGVTITGAPIGADDRLVSTSSTAATWVRPFGTGSIGNNTINATPTVIVAQNIYENVAGTWALNFVGGAFSSPSNGVLECARAGLYNITYNISAVAATAIQFTAQLAKNTVAVPGSAASGHSHTAMSGAVSKNTFLQLIVGDQLILQIANNTNTDQITATWFNLSAVQIA